MLEIMGCRGVFGLLILGRPYRVVFNEGSPKFFEELVERNNILMVIKLDIS